MFLLLNTQHTDNNNQLFKLKQFDLKNILFTDDNKGKTIFILGGKNTGKSFLSKDIIFNNKDIEPIILSDEKTDIKRKYSDHNTIIQNIITNQQINKEKNIFIYNDFVNTMDLQTCNDVNINIDDINDINYHKVHKEIVIFENNEIINELIENPIYETPTILKDLIKNSYNWNLLTMFIIQYPINICPSLFEHIDYIFIFRPYYDDYKKRLYKLYAHVIPSLTFETFCKLIDININHISTYKFYSDFGKKIDEIHYYNHCLVIDNTREAREKSKRMMEQKDKEYNEITERIFWYKAVEHRDFKINGKGYWDFVV